MRAVTVLIGAKSPAHFKCFLVAFVFSMSPKHNLSKEAQKMSTKITGFQPSKEIRGSLLDAPVLPFRKIKFSTFSLRILHTKILFQPKCCSKGEQAASLDTTAVVLQICLQNLTSQLCACSS